MNNIKKPLVCVYHEACNDGLVAAAVLNQFMRNTHAPYYYAGNYKRGVTDDLLEMAQGVEVFIVDFSFSTDDTLALCEVAESVVMIDHHKSSIQNFEGLEIPGLEKFLSKDASGAMLTHQYFQAIERGRVAAGARPHEISNEFCRLITLVDDYDRWQHKHKQSKAFHEYLAFLKQRFLGSQEGITKLINYEIPNLILEPCIERGQAIYDNKLAEADSIIRSCAKAVSGIHPSIQVIAANGPMSLANEIGNSIAKRFFRPALVYSIEAEGIKLAFRSDVEEGNPDNAWALATHYGGGGHLNAAGAFVKRGTYTYLDLITSICLELPTAQYSDS